MKDLLESKTTSDFLKPEKEKTKTNSIEIPSISLPKGGGALKGIDEKFLVNAVNGSASFSVPLPFSHARGAVPNLNLSYNSGSGNGVFGLGWNINLASVKRKTDNGLPQYFDTIDSDIFLFSEAEDLVPELKKEVDGSFSLDDNNEYIIHEKESPDTNYKIRFYKPRIEGLYARIERWTNKTNGIIKWRVISKENVTTLFGWSGNSVISNPNNTSKIFEWLPEFVFDDKGNCCQYVYKKEDESGLDDNFIHNRNRLNNNKITYTNLYLEKILYGNKIPYKKMGDPFLAESNYMFQTVFDYGEYNQNSPYTKINNWDFRQDAFSDYRSGFEIRTTRLCKRVLLFHFFDELPDGSALVRSLDFEYDTATEPDFTFLSILTTKGYIKLLNGKYTHKKLPSMEFTYEKHSWSKEVKTISQDDLIHSPSGLDELQYQFTDLYNEGLSGILTEQGNGWYYKHNLGNGKFEQAKLIMRKPSFIGLGDQLQLADLDSNGYKQLVNLFNEPKGYFLLDDDNEWQLYKRFKNLPTIDFSDPNTRMLDLDGDGKPEVLITEDTVFTWYKSEGKNGFSEARKEVKIQDEEKGPHLVFSESFQTIFLADMSGDGMTDLVRIRNGEICYWPNMGYGKFGAKVSMDNSPVFDFPDSFNPMYLHLSDIDGSGTTDVIYLGKNKCTCWKNLSGNRFGTSPFEIEAFPEMNNKSKVMVTDLLGNGVACIVWTGGLSKNTSVPLRYIDLMNSKKPHLMIGYKNNFGKEVSFEYTSSTAFYLEDKQAGTPWITKLHFPVHCISKTEIQDRISGTRFVTSYKYHHGYYDHHEREFRGFGKVEQTDSEYYEHWVSGNASNVVNEELHQEPIVSKTWFHTGAFFDMDKILNQFSKEYWYAEMEKQGFTVSHSEIELPNARIISNQGVPISVTDQLNAEEWREAIRACKSMSLRSETFANDAPETDATPDEQKKQLTPYSVSMHNCVIELMQPKGKNKHAVFAVKESEAISYSYERNTDDPRISHRINIKLDEFGNILESASIVYPRILTDLSLPTETQQAQSNQIIIYSENCYTNDCIAENTNRLRLPSESRTYELKGVNKSSNYYSIDDFNEILNRSSPVDYHEFGSTPDPGTTQKRLIEHIRTNYYKNDLSGALPLHELESLAFTFENYQLAFTPQLVTNVYGTKVDAILFQEGKYTHSEGDDNWWIRSGTKQYMENTETVTDAQNRFYLPLSFTDPYGTITQVKYDSNYFLFIEETEDVLGNRSTVDRFNYRILAAQRMKDINHNLTEVITDELGLVKATAVMGKGNEADDLFALTEFTTADEQNDIDSFFLSNLSTDLTNLGKKLLHHASERFVYDFDIYKNTGKPTLVASIRREEHFIKNSDSPVQLSFEYSNGTGSVVMKKTQAEPGLAKKTVVNPDDTYVISTEDTSSLIPKQLRWIGNGRSVLNNKGNIVKKYEPYFSVTHRYENAKKLVQTGVSPLLYYDAAGRVIKTIMPDETFSYTQFDAWKQAIYDANDTVLQSAWYMKRSNHLIDVQLLAEGKDPIREKSAADKAAKHANTPTVLHFDTLGRPILSIEHTKNSVTDADEFHRTKIRLDAEGNLRSTHDARELVENAQVGNTVMIYKYDMLGNIVYQESMDGGIRHPLLTSIGKPLRTWDERNFEFQYFYDELHRPLYAKIIGGDGPALLNHVFDRVFYGESETNPEGKNCRGKIIEHYDTGGVLLTHEYNFKGDPLSTTRKLYKDYKSVPNWVITNLITDVEEESFVYKTETNALGWIIKQTAPDGSIVTPVYNEAGLLNSEYVHHQNPVLERVYIKDIDYNEKGQRTKIVYGNDVHTRFYYDNQTFRLKRLETKRLNNDPLQDWYYTFDAVGNITHIEDKNIPVIFFNNQKITGVSEYTYDAMYRLIEAKGRENDVPLLFGLDDNWNDLALMMKQTSGDPMTIRNYTQRYQYDKAGNIQQLRHQSIGNNWTRNYDYEKTSNRLKSTQIGTETYSYTHHLEHGFIVSMPHLEEMGWNFKEEMVKSIKQKVNPGNGSAESTYYQYDGQGQRIRKITENSATEGAVPSKKEERIYIATFETFRTFQANNVNFERETLNLMDDGHRFVMIETVVLNTNPGPSSEPAGTRLTRYQLHNHTGSAGLELDDMALVISYEEYHPFGTTAYQAHNSAVKAAYKRYRYTGMERDSETGLEYHSARYYVPWLGRWLSPDPIGPAGGINDYAYCANNPLNRTDTSGKEWCWNVFADDCELDTPRIFGGVKMVGGALETVAGAGLVSVGVATSEIGIGIPIAAAGVFVTAHGVDTTISGARTVWEGEAVDSFTSQGLQELGMSRNAANFTDAGISVVGTLGASLATRAPAAAAAGIDLTESSISVSQAAGAPSAAGLTNPLGYAVGHTRVGVTLGDGSATVWSHLTVPGERVMMSGGALVESGEAIVTTGTSLAPRFASVATVPVSQAEAQAAMSLIRSSAPAATATEGVTSGSMGAYSFMANDCATYGQSVLNAAGVTASGSTPTTLFISTALRSEAPISTILTAPVVMQPVTTAGVVVNASVGISSYSSSSYSGDETSSSVSSYEVSSSETENACYSEPYVVDYSQMVCE